MTKKQVIFLDAFMRVIKAGMTALTGATKWVAPWRKISTGEWPRSAITGKVYRGGNALLLACQCKQSVFWFGKQFALKEIAAGRLKVKPEFTEYFGTSEKTGKLYVRAKGNPHAAPVGKFSVIEKENKAGEKYTSRFWKFNTVLSGDMFDLSGTKWAPAELPELPAVVSDTFALDFAAVCKINVELGGDRACFIPKLDRVQLPAVEQFNSQAGFNGTAFHEYIHWTGHESRLARKFGKRFGDHAYSVEELVAELGATMLCAKLGIAYELENHANYLKHWHAAISECPQIFFTAGKAAHDAADYLIKLYQYNGGVLPESAPLDDALLAA